MKRPLSILVVDAERAVADALEQALGARGHQVRVARDAREALGGELPDVLVADVDLPDRGGLELLESLRSAGAAPRAVLTTSRPNFEDCRRALQLGAADVLAKPLRTEDLVRVVEDSAAERRDHRVLRRVLAVAEGCPLEAARLVSAFALEHGIATAARARLASAVAEAVDNACKHAYPDGEGCVELTLRVEPRDLVCQVRDRGLGFDPLEAGLERMTSAMDGGLARISSLTEDVALDSRVGAGTEVELRVAALRASFDEEDGDFSEHDFLLPAEARRLLAGLGDDDGTPHWQIPPALAVCVGRMLAGPDPRRVLRTAFRS